MTESKLEEMKFLKVNIIQTIMQATPKFHSSAIYNVHILYIYICVYGILYIYLCI